MSLHMYHCLGAEEYGFSIDCSPLHDYIFFSLLDLVFLESDKDDGDCFWTERLKLWRQLGVFNPRVLLERIRASSTHGPPKSSNDGSCLVARGLSNLFSSSDLPASSKATLRSAIAEALEREMYADAERQLRDILVPAGEGQRTGKERGEALK